MVPEQFDVRVVVPKKKIYRLAAYAMYIQAVLDVMVVGGCNVMFAREKGILAHHKRKRPKSRRRGCAMCKYWKQNGIKGGLEAQTIQERIARDRERFDLDDYFVVDDYDIDAEADWEDVEEMMTMLLYEAADDEEEEYG